MKHYLLFAIALFSLAACQMTGTSTTPTTAVATAVSAATPIPLPELPATLPPPATTPAETTPEAAPETATLPPLNAPTTTPTNMAPPNPDPTAILETAVTSISLTPLVNAGLIRPVYLTHAGDDRLFVVEQRGLIRIIENSELITQPFLDITERVGDTSNEQGLLSMAFDPAYMSNGRFFVNYTDNNGDTVISRFQVTSDPETADPNSELILLAIPQPFGNHNGGQVKFGPDGYLYIGMGDGGSQGDPQNNGQNPNSLLGSILRLDVTQEPYSTPASNPFLNKTARGETWAIGFRNPWRFSFDRLTGDLYIADVGQNSWEEVNFQPASSLGGENYGWNILEGSHCYFTPNCQSAGMILPIFEYDHRSGCSITGGYLYRGQQHLELYGNYFVADYCTGIIWSLFQEVNGTWSSHEVLRNSGLLIASFGEDVNGELYVVDHNGSIWQVEP